MKKIIIRLFVLCILSICHSIYAQSLLINEVMHSNVNGIMDDLNEFPDSWVEIYNNTNDPITANGLKIGTSENPSLAYTICDNVEINPHDYYIIYCDKKSIDKHTDFRIDCDDITHLYLFDNADGLIDEQAIPPMLAPNIAYGRNSENQYEWGYLLHSTPGSINDSIISNVLLEKPVFSHDGGLYTQPFSLAISNPEGPEESSIHYTTNGSEPTTESPIFPDSILIDKTTIVRAKVFSPNCHSPLTITHSYIFSEREQNLPYISIVTDSSYLYDDEIGIYAEGTYGVTHPDAESQLPNSFGRHNYTFNWRRPSNFEYYDPKNSNGTSVNQMCEFRIGGNTSRQHPLKSLVLYANQRFGKKRFSYPFWNDKKNIDKFKSLYLRNAGGDFIPLTYIRDAYAQLSVGSHVDLDWSAYQPAIIYINGEYKGIINLREFSKEDIVWSNHNKLENIDFIQNWHYVETGDLDDFNHFLDVVRDSSSTFSDLFNMMDINEFLNYYVLNTFFSNKDFPANNNLAWKEKSASGKWRWIAKDMDQSSGMTLFNTELNEYNYPSLNYNTRIGNFEETGNNTAYYCSIFNKILSFNQSRNQFIDKATVYTGTFLSSSANIHRLDSLFSNIDNEMDYFTPLYNIHSNDWRYWCNNMREWLSKRTDFFYHHLQDFFSLGDTTSLIIESHKAKQLYFNDIKVENNRFDGKYYEGRHLFLSYAPDKISYTADTFTVDTTQASSYWIVRYQLNDSIVQTVIQSDNLLYYIPQNAKNVYITDSLFFSMNSLPAVTYTINEPTCSIAIDELSLISPSVHDQLGNSHEAFLTDTLLSLNSNVIDWNVHTITGETTHFHQTIVFIDSCAPEIDCQLLDTIELSLTTNDCSTKNTDVTLPIPMAIDNCDTQIKGVPETPQEYMLGENTIYWTFTDDAGNSSRCPQTILVIDKCAPEVNCNDIPSLTFDVFTSDCEINSQLLNIQTPNAIDNCEKIIEGSAQIPDYFKIGDHTIDWHFVDTNGNESLCNQSIVIADHYAPIVQHTESDSTLYITLPINNNTISSDEIELPPLYAIDNCNEQIEGEAALPSYFTVGDNNVMWSFSDAHGNISYFNQNIFLINRFKLMIHPNPVSNTLYISGLGPNEEIKIYNTIGQKILETKSSGNPTLIDMTNFTNNLYFILIRNQYFKVIKGKE